MNFLHTNNFVWQGFDWIFSCVLCGIFGQDFQDHTWNMATLKAFSKSDFLWFLICISYMRRLMHDIVTLCWPITKSSNGQFDYNRDALVIYYSTDCINMIVWYDYIEDRKYYCKIIQIYNSANYFNIGFIMCHLNKVRKFFPRVYHCSTHFWKEHHQVGLGIGT